MPSDHPPTGGSSEEDHIEHRLEDVWLALDEDEVEEAFDLAEELAEEFPDNGDVVLALAATSYEAGLVRETLAAAARAGELGAEDEPLRRWYMAASYHYLWQFDKARERLDELICDDEEFAEAWYLLAQVCEIEGDEVGARRGYQRAFNLDPERFPRPHRIDDSVVRDAVQAARDELPERFQLILDELAIVIEMLPSRELAAGETDDAAPVPPDVLGLFVGSSQLDQSVMNPIDQPGIIFLFQRNLERVCNHQEMLVSEIRTTLWHELAHYLGFEEDEMADLGLE